MTCTSTVRASSTFSISLWPVPAAGTFSLPLVRKYLDASESHQSTHRDVYGPHACRRTFAAARNIRRETHDSRSTARRKTPIFLEPPPPLARTRRGRRDGALQLRVGGRSEPRFYGGPPANPPRIRTAEGEWRGSSHLICFLRWRGRAAR